MGEIKSVGKDVLTVETAYSDADLKIEWEDIASVERNRVVSENFDWSMLA